MKTKITDYSKWAEDGTKAILCARSSQNITFFLACVFIYAIVALIYVKLYIFSRFFHWFIWGNVLSI